MPILPNLDFADSPRCSIRSNKTLAPSIRSQKMSKENEEGKKPTQEYLWKACSVSQNFPTKKGVYVGNDIDGSAIYVGRAFHGDENLPAKVIPSKKACYVSWNGLEIFKSDFQYMTGPKFSWVAASNGNVPDGSLMSGKTSYNEPLYVGRARHGGSLMTGKIHQSHGCLYLPFDGLEHSKLNYEALVIKIDCSEKPYWVRATSWNPVRVHSIYAGNNSDGSPNYIGRVTVGDEVLPAKIVANRNAAYATKNGREIEKGLYEILCGGNTKWVPGANGSIHTNAVIGGHTSRNESLYIGRARYNGSMIPGKINRSHGVMYLAYNGEEIAVKNYEILIEC